MKLRLPTDADMLAIEAESLALIAPPAMSEAGLDRLADALGLPQLLPRPAVLDDAELIANLTEEKRWLLEENARWRDATVAGIANADALVDAQVNQVLLAGANERLCKTNNRLRDQLARAESFAWVLGVAFVAMTVAVILAMRLAARG